MTLSLLTPLPPARSGIAHYSSMLLPALRERLDVRAFDSMDGYRAAEYELAVYQLGNNPHHEWIYEEAMRTPGIAVLHDLVLHHLIVEMTLARGDAEGYVRELRASHGAMGEAWARARAAGLHTELANFLMPASIEVANRSRAVIVHNRYAADRLRSFGVTTPIEVVPHPWVPEAHDHDRGAIRVRYGFDPGHRVIGFFGFLTSAKRGEVVLEAFARAKAKFPALRLLIVGEPAPNIDPALLQGDGIVATGYVSDEEFPAFYAAADRLVNLRYPTAGETSGTLIRALDAGKPVAVSDYAQFAEFPADCVVRVPFGAGEIERLVAFFTEELPDPSAAQRSWLEANATLASARDGYLRAFDAARQSVPRAARPAAIAGLALFPQLEVVGSSRGEALRVTVRNAGDQVLETRTYGRPAYRVIAKAFEGERVVWDRWVELPADLHPGEETTLSLAIPASATSVRLYHALQDIPMLEPEAWAELEADRVR